MELPNKDNYRVSPIWDTSCYMYVYYNKYNVLVIIMYRAPNIRGPSKIINISWVLFRGYMIMYMHVIRKNRENESTAGVA